MRAITEFSYAPSSLHRSSGTYTIALTTPRAFRSDGSCVGAAYLDEWGSNAVTTQGAASVDSSATRPAPAAAAISCTSTTTTQSSTVSSASAHTAYTSDPVTPMRHRGVGHHRTSPLHTSSSFADTAMGVGGMRACARILQQHRLRLKLHYLTPHMESSDASCWPSHHVLHYTVTNTTENGRGDAGHVWGAESAETPTTARPPTSSTSFLPRDDSRCVDDVEDTNEEEAFRRCEAAALEMAYRPLSDEAGRVRGRRHVKSMQDEPYSAHSVTAAAGEPNMSLRSLVVYGSTMTNPVTRARRYESFDRLFHRLLETGQCALDVFFTHPEAPAAAVLLQRVLRHRTPSLEFAQRALLLTTRRPFTPISMTASLIAPGYAPTADLASSAAFASSLGSRNNISSSSSGSSNSSSAEIAFALQSICQQLRRARSHGRRLGGDSVSAPVVTPTLYDHPTIRCLLLEALIQEGLYTNVVTVMRETPDRWVTRGLWSALVHAAAQGRLPDSVLLWRLLGHRRDGCAQDTDYCVTSKSESRNTDTRTARPSAQHHHTYRVVYDNNRSNNDTGSNSSSNRSSSANNMHGTDNDDDDDDSSNSKAVANASLWGHLMRSPRITCAGYSIPSSLMSDMWSRAEPVGCDLHACPAHLRHASSPLRQLPHSFFDVRTSTLTCVDEEEHEDGMKADVAGNMQHGVVAATTMNEHAHASSVSVSAAPAGRHSRSPHLRHPSCVKWVWLTSSEVAYARVHFLTDTVAAGDGRGLDGGVRRIGAAVWDYACELVRAADAMRATTMSSVPLLPPSYASQQSCLTETKHCTLDASKEADSVHDRAAQASRSDASENDTHSSCHNMSVRAIGAAAMHSRMMRHCRETAELLHFASEGVVHGLDAATATALLLRAGVSFQAQSSPLLALAILRRYLATCSTLRRELAWTWYRHTMMAVRGADAATVGMNATVGDGCVWLPLSGQSTETNRVSLDHDDMGRACTLRSVEQHVTDTGSPYLHKTDTNSNSNSNSGRNDDDDDESRRRDMHAHATNRAPRNTEDASSRTCAYKLATAAATYRALLQHSMPPDPTPFLVFFQILRDSHEVRSHLDKRVPRNNNSNHHHEEEDDNEHEQDTHHSSRHPARDTTTHSDDDETSTARVLPTGSSSGHAPSSSSSSSLPPHRAAVIPMMHWELAWNYFQRLNRENPHWFTGSTIPGTHNATHMGQGPSSSSSSSGYANHYSLSGHAHDYHSNNTMNRVEQRVRRGHARGLDPDDAEDLCRCVLDILCRGADPWMTLAVLRAMSARHLVDGLDMTLWLLHRLDPSHHTNETQAVARRLFYWLLDEVGLHLQPRLQHHLIAVARVLIRLSLSEEWRLLYHAVLDAVACFRLGFRRSFLAVLQDVICPACCAPLTSHDVFEERVCGCCLCVVPAKDRATEWASFELSQEHVRRIRERRRAQRRLTRQRLHTRLLQPASAPTHALVPPRPDSDHTRSRTCSDRRTASSPTSARQREDGKEGEGEEEEHDGMMSDAEIAQKEDENSGGSASSPYYEAARSRDAADVLRRAVLLPGMPLSASSSSMPTLFTGLLTAGRQAAVSTMDHVDVAGNDSDASPSYSLNSDAGSTMRTEEDIRRAIAESYRRLALSRLVRRQAQEQRRGNGNRNNADSSSADDAWQLPVVTAALPTRHDGGCALWMGGSASHVPSSSSSSSWIHNKEEASRLARMRAWPERRMGSPSGSSATWTCVWCQETNAPWSDRVSCAACGAATGPEATWRVFIYSSSSSSSSLSHPSPLRTMEEIRARIANAAGRDEDAIGAGYLLMLYRRLFLLYATPHDVEERIVQLVHHLCRLRERVLAAYVYTRFLPSSQRRKDHTVRQLAQLFVGPILYHRMHGDARRMNKDVHGMRRSESECALVCSAGSADAKEEKEEEADVDKRIDALTPDELRANEEAFFHAVFTRYTCRICFGEHAWQRCPMVTRDFRATLRASAVQQSPAEKQASMMAALQHAVTAALRQSKTAQASHLLVHAYASFVRSPHREQYAQTCPVEVNRLSILLCDCKQYRRAAFVLCHVPLHARWNEAYLRMTHYFNVTEAEAMSMLRHRPLHSASHTSSGNSDTGESGSTSTSDSSSSSFAASPHPNFVQVTLTCCMCLDERHASFACPRLTRWLDEVSELRRIENTSQTQQQQQQQQQQQRRERRRRLRAQVDGWTTAGPERLHAWYRFLLDHIDALYDLVAPTHGDTADTDRHYSATAAHTSQTSGALVHPGQSCSSGSTNNGMVASGERDACAEPVEPHSDSRAHEAEEEDTNNEKEERHVSTRRYDESETDLLVYAVETMVQKLVAVRWRSYAYRLYARCPVWCVSNRMTAALLRMNGYHEDSIATLCTPDEDVRASMLTSLTSSSSSSSTSPVSAVRRCRDVCTSAAARCAAVPTSRHCLLCFESSHSFFDCPELAAQPSMVAKLRYVMAHVGRLCSSADGLMAAAAFVYAVYNQGLLSSDVLRGEPALVRDLLDVVHRCLAAGQVMAAVRVLRRLPVELVAPEPTYPHLWRAAGLPEEVVAARRAELLALYDAEGIQPAGDYDSVSAHTPLPRRVYSARFFALLNHALHDGLCRHCFMHGHSVTGCPVFHAEVSFGRDYVAAYRMSMMSEQLDRAWQDAYLLKLVLFHQSHHAFMPYHIAGVASALNAIAAMWSFRGEPGIALRHLLSIPPAYRRRQAFKHILHSLRVSPAEMARVLDGFYVSPDDGGAANTSNSSYSSSAHRSSSSNGSGAAFLSAHHLLLPRPAFRDVALRQVFEPFPAAMAALAESEARMQHIMAQHRHTTTRPDTRHGADSDVLCGTRSEFSTDTNGAHGQRTKYHRQGDAAATAAAAGGDNHRHDGAHSHDAVRGMCATDPTHTCATAASWKMQSGGIVQLRDDFDPILSELEDAVGMKLGSRHILFTSAVDMLSAVHAAAAASASAATSSRRRDDLVKGAVEATVVRESHATNAAVASLSATTPVGVHTMTAQDTRREVKGEYANKNVLASSAPASASSAATQLNRRAPESHAHPVVPHSPRVTSDRTHARNPSMRNSHTEDAKDTRSYTRGHAHRDGAGVPDHTGNYENERVSKDTARRSEGMDTRMGSAQTMRPPLSGGYDRRSGNRHRHRTSNVSRDRHQGRDSSSSSSDEDYRHTTARAVSSGEDEEPQVVFHTRLRQHERGGGRGRGGEVRGGGGRWGTPARAAQERKEAPSTCVDGRVGGAAAEGQVHISRSSR